MGLTCSVSIFLFAIFPRDWDILVVIVMSVDVVLESCSEAGVSGRRSSSHHHSAL